MIRDSCKLYNGDCLEIMEELIKDGIQVDLTVTSPPYDDLRNYNNSLVWNFDIFKEVANKLYNIWLLVGYWCNGFAWFSEKF